MKAEDVAGAISAIGRLNNGIEFLEVENSKLREQLELAQQLIKERDKHIEKIEAMLPSEVRNREGWKNPPQHLNLVDPEGGGDADEAGTGT